MNQPQYDAIVIGAGFGGMGAAIQLKRSGYDNLLILEREDDPAGPAEQVVFQPELVVRASTAG